jgi:hypothetical protein
MTDYGHELLFGSFIAPTAAAPDRVVSLARLSEQAGRDLVTVQDHPYNGRIELRIGAGAFWTRSRRMGAGG